MPEFTTRAPIFDRRKNTFAYELDFRSGIQCYSQKLRGEDSDAALRAFVEFGKLSDGKRSVVHFSRDELLEGIPDLFPRKTLSVEVSPEILTDDDANLACQKLKKSGHLLVLDEASPSTMTSEIYPLIDIARIPFDPDSADVQEQLCHDLTSHNIQCMASNVETPELFEQATEAGFQYFQGEFFAKPDPNPEAEIHTSKLTYLRLVQEVFKPELSYAEAAKIIEQDVSLSRKLLQFMNSAWFGLKYEIRSIKHALVLLGPQEIKDWISIVVVRDMGEDKPHELLLRSLSRAKVAEQLGLLFSDMKQAAPELFLMGLLSCLDALTDMPMPEVLDGLPVSHAIKRCLLEKDCDFKPFYDTIKAYEQGEWETFSALASTLSLDEELLPEMFQRAHKWANQVLATS